VGITSRMVAERGRRQAQKLGIDPKRVPPGQYLTERFPVLTYGRNPKFDLRTWSLSIHGEVDEPYSLRWDELLALPQTTLTTDIHCVTRWSKLDTTWTGVRVSELLERAQVRTSGKFVMAHCDGGYTTNVPLADVTGGKAWIAFEYDGAALAAEHGGPARLLIPHLYFWKSAKWVRGLRLTERNEPGFWEQLGYHDRGDPWREQRYQGDP